MIYLKFYSEEDGKTYYLDYEWKDRKLFGKVFSFSQKPKYPVSIGDGWGCNKNNIKKYIKTKLLDNEDFKSLEPFYSKYKISHVYVYTNYQKPKYELLFERPQIMKNLEVYKFIRKF